jgi:hypothetical protein
MIRLNRREPVDLLDYQQPQKRHVVTKNKLTKKNDNTKASFYGLSHKTILSCRIKTKLGIPKPTNLT